MSGKIESPSPVIWAIGLGIFVVSFIILFWLGDYRFVAGVFLALLIALLATIVIYLCFHPGNISLEKKETSGAPEPAGADRASPVSPQVEEKPAETKTVAAPTSAPVSTPEEAIPSEPATGERPAGLDQPRGGVADDLKKIKGVGPKMEQTCNFLGFWHFDQIAAWTDAEVAWVDENLTGFKGRVTRDAWVEQAKILANDGETEFSKRVDDGTVY